MRILVIGAGALGAASALHLKQAGHDVSVLDAGEVAGRTTGLAAGILSLGVMSPMDRVLVQETLGALDALDTAHRAAWTGADTGPLLRRPGSYQLVPAGPAADLASEIAEHAHALGAPAELLDGDAWQAAMAARGLEVHAEGIGVALSLPSDAWTLSTDATNLMMRAARDQGVKYQANRAVAGLTREAHRVTGVRFQDGTERSCDAVVLATGAWSRGFLARHGLALPAVPFRTHAAVLETDTAPAFPITHDDPGSYYLRPEGPRHVLVGNGTVLEPIDPEGFTNEPEPFFVEGLAARLPQRFPCLETAGLVRAWRGVLTGTPDRAPLIGAHPDAPGLFLCTGGNGFGFMRSWALGRCLAWQLDVDAAGRGTEHAAPGADLLAWMDPARFWPNPPESFPLREGFTLDA